MSNKQLSAFDVLPHVGKHYVLHNVFAPHWCDAIAYAFTHGTNRSGVPVAFIYTDELEFLADEGAQEHTEQLLLDAFYAATYHDAEIIVLFGEPASAEAYDAAWPVSKSVKESEA